jgi:hypothetical protein
MKANLLCFLDGDVLHRGYEANLLGFSNGDVLHAKTAYFYPERDSIKGIMSVNGE